MYNWGVDLKELKKDREKFIIWKLEQMVNFGLDGGKIPESDLRKYWERLYLDSHKKRFMGFLLWGKKYLQRGR